MPQSLTVKRQIKTKLQRTVDSNSKVKSIGFRKRMKYRIGMWFNRRKISIKNTISNLELWYGSLKTIEGHFGSGVAAYFKFLRWLFILNLLLITMAFAFVTLPQILFNSIESVVLDENVSKLNQSRAVNINQHTFSVWDIFTGEVSQLSIFLVILLSLVSIHASLIARRPKGKTHPSSAHLN